MQVDLRTYPHTVGVTSYRLIAAGKHSAGKDNDPCFKSRILALYDKSLVAFVLTPSALTTEVMLNAEAVAVAQNYLCVAEC